MRKLLVFLLFLGVLAFGVDFVAKGFAQERAEDELKTRLSLPTSPDVTFEGWPFLLSAARGEFRAVKLEADRMEFRALVFSDVRLDLEDVRFSIRDLALGEGEDVTTAGGTGSVTLDEQQLSRAVRRAGAPFGVDLQGGQSFDVAGRALTVSAEGAPPVEIALPAILDNVTYESAEVTDEGVTIRLSLKATTLRRDLGS